MLPHECAFTLSSGKRCAQLALRGRRFCRFHDKEVRLQKTAREEQRICAEIQGYDLQWLIACMIDTLEASMHHTLSPSRQHLIFEAVSDRLEELLIEQQIADTTNPASPCYDPSADAARLTRSHLWEREIARGRLPSPPRSRAVRMEDLFGPAMAGQPIPAGVDPNHLRAVIDYINGAPSPNRAPARAPARPKTR